MRLSPQNQQNRQSSLRFKWECWMEDGGLTLSSRKNPSKASTNTCLPSSLICVTGEPCLTLIPNFGGTVSKFKNDLFGFLFSPSITLTEIESPWILIDFGRHSSFIMASSKKRDISDLTYDFCFLRRSFSCVWRSGFQLCVMTVFFFFLHMLMLSLFRESEDAALLLLKEIYDKLGVPFEQPQW